MGLQVRQQIRWHLNRDLMEERSGVMNLSACVPGRVNSHCKGPGKGAFLRCSSWKKESQCGQGNEKEGEWGEKVSEDVEEKGDSETAVSQSIRHDLEAEQQQQQYISLYTREREREREREIKIGHEREYRSNKLKRFLRDCGKKLSLVLYSLGAQQK